jgi:hypothetical protein
MPLLSTGSYCVDVLERGTASGLGMILTNAEMRRLIACAASASDCDAALACASRNHPPSYCASNPGDSCDGSTLVRCPATTDWPILTTECAQWGLRCEVANGGASCTNGMQCDPHNAAHCDGDQLISCDPTTKLQASASCSQVLAGTVCRPAGSASDCLPAGNPCSTTGSSCAGQKLVACVGGETVTLDCAPLEATCTDTPSGFDCVENNAACTRDSMDACNGDSMEICVHGSYAATNCRTIGKTACVVNGGITRCE